MSTTSTTSSKSNTPKRSISQAIARLMPKEKQKDFIPVSALEKRLTERSAITKQLSALQNESSRLNESQKRKYIQLRQVRDKIEGYKSAVARENTPDGPSSSQQSLKAAEQEESSLLEQIEEDARQVQSKRWEAAELRGQIELLTRGISQEDAKEHLQALKKARDELQRIDELIQSTSSVSHFDESHDETLEALQSAREDVLAEIATGEAEPELLSQIDAQIEEMLSDSDGSQTNAITEERNKHQTLAGLDRRRSAIQIRHDQLQAQTPEVIEQLVITRVEAISQHYLRHAQALIKTYQQIQGMTQLLTSAVPNTKVKLLSSQWTGALIPALPLTSFEDVLQHDRENGVLFSGRLASSLGERLAAAEEVRLQLDDMGLSELFPK